jgi:carotenoid cleavage dioxygenase-like enzyme
MAMAGEGNSEEPVYGSALWKYDLRTGACVEHQLGDGVRGAEPVFAEAVEGGGEDDGWVVTLIHDTVSDESRLIIVDAQNFSAPPVATIHLPRRVPYGAHGTWVADRAAS